MRPTGFFELLMIVVTLVAGLPLFVSCTIMAQRDMGLTYLEDKSTWALEPDYVMVHQDTNGDGIADKHYLIPEGFTPLNISVEQAATMMYVQDEYGVPTARKLYFKYDMNDYEEPIIDYNKSGDASHKAKYNWAVPYRQRAARVGVDNSTDCVGIIANKSDVKTNAQKDYYMVWNSEIDNWVVTEVPINTIGIER
ncbi:MAG: hypothetical protein NC131_15035 [Roseburia sp.]|nr:hypothetical protein [Roseburia sp.]